MWVHVLSVLALAALPVVWWALQRANGGEKMPDCCGNDGGGCTGCATKGSCDHVGAPDAHAHRH